MRTNDLPISRPGPQQPCREAEAAPKNPRQINTSPHSCAGNRNPATARLRREGTLPLATEDLSRPKTWAHWIPVTGTGMRVVGGACSPLSLYAGDGRIALIVQIRRLRITPINLRHTHLFTHSCARHRNPAMARLRREGMLFRATISPPRPKTWAHWIAVTGTGMRETGGTSLMLSVYPEARP